MKSLVLLNARIKLQKRHLLEWNTLTANQRIVLGLITEKYFPKLHLASNNIVALIILRNQKNTQLKRAMGEQRKLRELMRIRQKQEETLLKQVSELPE